MTSRAEASVTLRALLIAIVLIAITNLMHAEDAASPADRMRRAAELNSIDAASMEPWHLKISFQLFDAKGEAAETGTVEEWWKSPSLHKTMYTSPSYTSTEVQTADGLYRSKGASSPPYLLGLILQQVVHPISQQDIVDAKPKLRKHDFGNMVMDCIMLSREIKNVPYPPQELFPTYCFDPNVDSLRSIAAGFRRTTRNNMGTFQQHKVSVDQITSLNSINAFTAHIEELQKATLTEADFLSVPDSEKIDVTTIKVPYRVMAARILNHAPPIYPAQAKIEHLGGTVLILARVGRNGHLNSVTLTSAPNPNFADAALAAVKQWTFEPYTVDGAPVEVETIIPVNFNP
jgi:TonB family protein